MAHSYKQQLVALVNSGKQYMAWNKNIIFGKIVYIISGGFHKDQAEKFRLILENILKLDDSEGLVDGLRALIETIVHENVSLVISRQILSEISCHVPKLTDEMGKSVCSFALGKIQPRVISFEEQVASIRQHLADIFEREQCWKEAANVLVGIPLETGQK